MRNLVASIIVMASGVELAAQEQPPKLTLYKTAVSAACSSDETVWIDPETRTYYLKGDRLYGQTKRGGYNCRKQAEAAGFRAFKSQ